MGEETHPIVEDKDRRTGSIFEEQYKKALELFKSILANNTASSKKDFAHSQRNNIIAFVGDRGSGKTSCMLSFAELLKEYSSDIAKPSIIKEKKCYVMDSIDPSFFDDKSSNNILELIIGRLYSLFDQRKKDANRSGESINPHAVRELVDSFQKVKNSLCYLENKVSFSSDSLEELSYLAGTDNLKKHFYDLIQEFLRFFNSETLIISLDDIDLNTQNAYQMVEQIRKYMILPNVVFLMAVKFGQLRHVITQKMLVENKTLLDQNIITKAEVEDMSEKYIEKLMPHTSRVFLPDNESYMYRNVVLKKDIHTTHNVNPGHRIVSLRELVPALIFFKCRYLFYNTKGQSSPIIPRNLRELRMLIRMLHNMDDFEYYSISSYNQRHFKEYLFGTWIECLGAEYKRIALLCLAEDEPSLLNKKVIQLLYASFFKTDNDDKHQSHLFELPESLEDIVNVDNIPYNISLGDVFALLNHISKLATEKKAQNLVFFIKSLYSIRLYDYYCHTVENSNKDEDSEANKKSKSSTIPELNRRGALDNYTAYCQLVAGNFYEIEDKIIISNSLDKGYNRQRWMGEGKMLIKLIKDIEDEFKDIVDDDYSPEEIDQKVEEFGTKKLQLAEFLILISSRHFDRKDRNDLKEIGKNKYRLRSPAYFTKNLSSIKNIQFDMLAPLFNVLDFKLSYARFSSEGILYTLAERTKHSIYSLMHEKAKQRMKEWTDAKYTKSTLLQLAGLRNAELIDELSDYLIDNREDFSIPDNRERFVKFYKILGDFTLDMYVKSENENNKIKFSMFSALSEVLEDLEDEETTWLNDVLDSNRSEKNDGPSQEQIDRIIRGNQTMSDGTFLYRFELEHETWYNSRKQYIKEKAEQIGYAKKAKVWTDLYIKLYKELDKDNQE